VANGQARTQQRGIRQPCQIWRPARQIRSVSVIPSTVPAARPSSLPGLGELADMPTRELLETVVNSGYTGDPWKELARRLVAGALPDLEKAIRSGDIYRRCRRARCSIPQRRALQRPPLNQYIAAEAVEDCLERFRTDVLPRGEWEPNRGTTLEDFFAGCCVRHVPNRWRQHLRQLPPCAIELDALDEAGQAGVLAVVVDPPADPAAGVELRDLLTRALEPMSPDDRRAFELRAQGWSPAEIADLLGIARNTLDARISRVRKAARARRTR
jgi:DNA-directed RNA polymerase specialized sigma24 family protein